MCGIAGIFRNRSRRPVESRELVRMTDLLAHRGPDGAGAFTDGHFGFGHRRLSIIDPTARAAQPMSTEDGTMHISFNGEIYNYVELRRELSDQGVMFRTSSDTEVLLELFRALGPSCLRKLNGMFAFAIWNSRDGSLFLARDHVGIKPLYYSNHAEGLTFASEIKAVLSDSCVTRAPNPKVLDAYLRFGYVPGDQTMFEGIKRLLPGHYMHIVNGSISVRCYWDIVYEDPGHFRESARIDEAESLMQDAVRLQLRSDVPLGVFLSGGVDSSAIVALTHSQGVRNLNTYSIGWDHGEAFNESKYARQVSDRFSTTHHEYWMTATDFQESLESFTWLMDEPVTEAAAVSLYKIAQVARKDVTVVLSGEGADEVFGGYPIYLFMQVVELYKRLPATVRKTVTNPLLSVLGPTPRKYAALSELPLSDAYMGVSFYDREATYALVTGDALSEIQKYPVAALVAPFYSPTAAMGAQRRMQYLDLKTWLVDDLLIKADRMTMGASVELRVPFLDYRLLEFSARLPPRLRIKHGQPKYLMKKAAERYLPKDIIYRKKRGFPTPLADLFRNGMRSYVTDTLGSRSFRERGLFRSDCVDSLLARHVSGDEDNHRSLWHLLVLENWYTTFIDPETLTPPHQGPA
jgi:asparagine synthase (glutamine-hydrolysing)